jgi:hypothetical protein
MAINRRNIEMHIAVQIEPMARPSLVPGRRLAFRAAAMPVSTVAAIIVTGQASVLWPAPALRFPPSLGDHALDQVQPVFQILLFKVSCHTDSPGTA